MRTTELLGVRRRSFLGLAKKARSMRHAFQR